MKNIHGKLMTLSEFSRATGIDSRKLRYMDEKRKLIPVSKTINGFRFYSEEQICDAMEIIGKRVVIVYHTQDCDLELMNRVREREKSSVVIEVIEDDDGKELNRVIIQANKGLVSKIYVTNEKNLITDKWDEHIKWFGYMKAALIKLEIGE